MLNEMRYGELSQRSVERFKSLDREIIYEDGVSAAELYVRPTSSSPPPQERMNTNYMRDVAGSRVAKTSTVRTSRGCRA